MPIYQGYGSFPITVGDRRFQYFFTESGPSFSDFQIESEDGKFFVDARGDILHVYGSDFPGTSKKRPREMTYRPANLAIRSPGDAVKQVIEWCLSVSKES